MKKVTLILIVLFLVVSCKKEKVSPNTEPAYLTLNVGVKIVEMDVYKVKKSTSSVEDYKVEIRDSENNIVLEYDRAADMPETIELTPGIYTVLAHSNNYTSAAFEAPYYYGEIEITLSEGESKTETVTCTLANCAVRIVYSKNINDDFDTYSTVVTNTDGGSLTYDEDETNLGYFSLSPITIEATLTNTSETKTLTGSITNPEAQKIYEIQLDASASDGTSLSINLVEDGTTSTEIITIGEGATTGREPAVGELIISEFMANPSGTDADGEYFEIYNTTNEAINLNGLIVKDGSDDQFVIDQDIIIQANSFVSLARSSSVAFTPDYLYKSTFNLNNSDESLGVYFLINTVETQISSIEFTQAAGFNSSVPDGASLELSINHLNAGDAADGNYWCTAVSEITSGGDLGTPGAINDCN